MEQVKLSAEGKTPVQFCKIPSWELAVCLMSGHSRSECTECFPPGAGFTCFEKYHLPWAWPCIYRPPPAPPAPRPRQHLASVGWYEEMVSCWEMMSHGPVENLRRTVNEYWDVCMARQFARKIYIFTCDWRLTTKRKVMKDACVSLDHTAHGN